MMALLVPAFRGNSTRRYLITMIFASLASGLSLAHAATTWPDPDWAVTPAAMAAPACQGFRDFAITSKQLFTDGLVVVKDGAIQFEYYDPKYGPTQPHALWSVSKTVTGALLGIAVQEGKVSLDRPLSDYYPDTSGRPLYGKIQLADLFYMDTGFVWDEYYAGDTRLSPVLTMLYGSGRGDMAAYTAARPMIPQGPGYQWNYDTGAPTVLMGVLKKAYGADYDHLPWDKLFNPLGMKSAVFERDPSGTFVGGAYAFLSPRDMARLGYLYLNGGRWKNQTILSEDWMRKTLTPSPGYLSDGTVIHDITDDGVYGGSIWLNRAVKAGFGRPYPTSPEDMYLAIGHFGQLMIVLPSQHMIIARTGYDYEYNSKLDELVSRAIACFVDPTYPVGKIIPPPASSKTSIWQDVETLETGLHEDIFEAAVAQSVCACHFVSGLDAKTCVKRSNIPAAGLMSRTKLEANSTDGSASWLGRILSLDFGKTVRAAYDPALPEFGCALSPPSAPE